MQIIGSSHAHGPQPIQPTHSGAKPEAASSASASASPKDELQISDVGKLLGKIQALPEVRTDKVNEIREALAQGTYDVTAKLDVAVERLLDEIG